MPRNGSDIYFIPPGTEGFPDTTIESAKYNAYIHDVETDLNAPRPIVAGGTGANDADEALANLGAEKSSQVVTNYDSHLWKPGSFHSAASATALPIPGHAFVGWVVSSDSPADPPANLNVVVHARDQNDIVVPGRVYVREKKSGVWGPWSIDGTGVSGPTPPVEPPDGLLWWDSISGQLFVWYNDGNSKQWVIASPVPDPAQFLLKAGDTMIGQLTLANAPAVDLHAVTKKYVDDKIAAIPAPVPSGTTMLFYNAAAPTGWTKLTAGADDRAIRVVSGSGGVGGGAVGFSTVFTRTGTDNFTLSTATIPPHTHATTSASGVQILDFEQAGSWDYVPGGQYKAGLNYYTTDSGSVSGGAHSHPIEMRVFYLDVILCRKD